MPAIPGTVGITGILAPKDSADTHATNEDIYGKGGFRPVADVTARDAITADRRKEGMWVYCSADGKVYTLSGGITNGDWVEVSIGGGVGLEGVNELITANRTVVPADNRMMFETYTVGAGVAPLTAEIDQAVFNLATDEGWTATFRVGVNDSGAAVPMYVACTTSEMSADNATFVTNFYSSEIGAYLVVRYSYAAALRGRFTVVNGRGTWVDNLGGVHFFDDKIIAPDYVIASPRVITDADHRRYLLTAAVVIGGLDFQLPENPTIGLTVTIATPGLATKITTTGAGIIYGPGYFSGSGVTDIRTSLDGHAITLVYTGSNIWGVSGGIGYWQVYSGGIPTGDIQTFTVGAPDASVGEFVVADTYGQLTTTSMTADTLVARAIHWTYADETARLAAAGFTIADVGKWALQSSDSTIWQLSSHGPPATWFEVSPSAASFKTSFEETSISLTDDTDFTAVEFDLTTTEAIAYRTAITSTTNVGLVTLYFYSDVARTEVVFTMSVDLSDTTTFVSDEAYGMELETTGTLYGTLFCSGVGPGESIDLWVSACVVEAGSVPTPLPSPYGQGIEDDGTGKPRIDLASDGGLTFDISDNLVVKADTTADVYPTLSASGVAITGAVTTTTDEDIAAKKRFTAVGVEPLLAPGAPSVDTYLQGHEILDSNGYKWRCTTGGTPGEWELVDHIADPSADYYTAELAAGATEVLEILTTGNVGTLQHLQIWGVVADPADYSSEFRVRVYPNSSLLGREMIWQGVGTVRQSYLTVLLPAAQDYCEVNDEDIFDTDEACVIFEDSLRYELARISSRSTGTVSFDEVLVDASSWAINTYVCSVAQFDNVPFRNTDATPANQGRVYLAIRNDHATNAVTFYVRALPLSLGAVSEMPS